MKQMHIRWLVASMLSFTMLLLVQCTPAAPAAPQEGEVTAPQETITLRVWDQFGGESPSAAIDLIYANFMEQHPNIVVEREIVPTDQADETSRTALSSGVGPDLVYMDITPARSLIDAGLLASLDDYFALYNWDERFTEDGLSWTTYNGKVWGLGAESEFVGLWYNKTLFEREGLEVPQTISEALQFCAEASERGYVPIAPWMERYGAVFMFMTSPIHNYVGTDYIEGLLFRGEGRWDSPEMIEAIKVIYEDMRNAGCFIEDAPAVTHDAAVDLFVSEQAFFLPVGSWAADQMTEFSESADVEIEMMPFFDMETGQPRVFTMGMGSAWFLSANSNHPDEAAMLLDYFFSDESVRILAEQARVLPPVTTDMSGFDVSSIVAWVAVQLATQDMGYNVDVLAPEAWNLANFDGAPAIWLGRKTVEEHMAELQSIWEEFYWADSQ